MHAAANDGEFLIAISVKYILTRCQLIEVTIFGTQSFLNDANRKHCMYDADVCNIHMKMQNRRTKHVCMCRVCLMSIFI